MKKTIFLAVSILFINLLHAQEIDKIKEFIQKNKLSDAKSAVEAYLSSDKNVKKGDGWYWKSVIYNSLSHDSTMTDVAATNARLTAFESYKKYVELDSKALEGTLSQNAVLFDLAGSFNNFAIKEFNNKKYENALDNFINADNVEAFITSKKFMYSNFTYPEFDTQMCFNIASAASNAKKEDIALAYYQKIVDRKITGQSYEEIYRYVVDRYLRKNDSANFNKYLAIGREIYPKDNFWCDVEATYGNNDDKHALFEKYEKLSMGGCKNYTLMYNYGVEMYNYVFAGEKEPVDYATYEPKISGIIKEAIHLENTPEANMLMCRYYYGRIFKINDKINAIKGKKPEDLKMKKNLDASLKPEYINMQPYALTIYNMYDTKQNLKGSEKAAYKMSINYLADYYEFEKDAAKSKFYTDKMHALDPQPIPKQTNTNSTPTKKQVKKS